VQLALHQGTPLFFYMRDDIWGDTDEPHSAVQLAVQHGTPPLFYMGIFLVPKENI
jgi:hypothetical protein